MLVDFFVSLLWARGVSVCWSVRYPISKAVRQLSRDLPLCIFTFRGGNVAPIYRFLLVAFCVRLFSLPDYEKAAELIFDIRYIRVSHDATEDMALLERFAYGSDP